MQADSNPKRENDPHALPDLDVFQMTAAEVCESGRYEDEWNEFMRRPAFRLASMNSKAHEALVDALVEELEIQGGWFYVYAFPGCLPDSDPVGPFPTRADALADARATAADDMPEDSCSVCGWLFPTHEADCEAQS